MPESFEPNPFEGIDDSLKPYSFALSDSETSAHPMAGTVIDQIIALRLAGEDGLADKLQAETTERMRATIQEWREQTLPYVRKEDESFEE
jgi:hypothetical protein